jgi:hypothetical protein
MEIPESKLIKSEIVLRDIQLNDEVKLTRKSLIRWLALALGLISPNESRLSVLNIFEAIIYYHIKEKRGPTYNDIVEFLKNQGIEMNEKTIRYHITQLKKSEILEDERGTYRISGFYGDNLAQAFEQIYKRKMELSFSNIREAINALQKMHE